ncbi:hypothetical protein Hanom_Chr06g00480971 [Helianthus anomalus]
MSLLCIYQTIRSSTKERNILKSIFTLSGKRFELGTFEFFMSQRLSSMPTSSQRDFLVSCSSLFVPA